MRIVRMTAMVGAIMAGGLVLASNASASPFSAAAMPLAKADGALATKAAYRGRVHYASHHYRHRRAHRPYYGYHRYRPYRYAYRPYRPAYYGGYYRPYRPYRPVYGAYRPYPRVVCRIRPSGYYGRPVRVCWRRW